MCHKNFLQQGIYCFQIPDAQMQCERWFEQPYDEMVASHLRYMNFIWAVAVHVLHI